MTPLSNLVAAAAWPLAMAAAGATKPNIIVMVSDDHRHDALGVVQRDKAAGANLPFVRTDRLRGKHPHSLPAALPARGESGSPRPDGPQPRRVRHHPRRLQAATHKYVENNRKPGWTQLFDLTSDPGENHNLAGDPSAAGLLERMKSRLDSEKRRAGFTGFGDRK